MTQSRSRLATRLVARSVRPRVSRHSATVQPAEPVNRVSHAPASGKTMTVTGVCAPGRRVLPPCLLSAAARLPLPPLTLGMCVYIETYLVCASWRERATPHQRLEQVKQSMERLSPRD